METRPLIIAVSGHRILTDLARVRPGVAKAVATIRKAYPQRCLRVISQLAEGADRLCAEAILRVPDSELIALLPMLRRAYVRDFGADGSPSRVHFECLLARAKKIIEMPPQPTRNEAYAQANKAVLQRCDVLLAVWDGEPAQGKGGTAQVVADARKLGKPVVIIRAGNREPDTLRPTTLGREQGRVRAERLSRSSGLRVQ